MKKYFLIPFILFLFIGCKKEKEEIEPICIKEKIEIFKSQSVCSTGATVTKYYFQNQNVYLFGYGDCIADGGSGVYDANCNLMGTLGTIAGLTKINGVDFYQNSTVIEILWSN